MLKRRLFGWIVAHRTAVIALVLIPTIAGGLAARKVGFDSRMENWFLDGDPTLTSYNEFIDRFDADQIVVMGIFAPDVFAPDVLKRLDQLTREVEDLPFVVRVRSLINARVPRAIDDAVVIAPLVRGLPRTPEARTDLRKWAQSNPLLKDNFVSRDGRAAAIVIEVDRRGDTSKEVDRLVATLWELAERNSKGGIRVRLAGKPITQSGFQANIRTDMRTNTPIAIVVLCVAIFVIFRRGSVALISLSVVIASLCWMFGLMFLFGIKMTTISSVLSGLVLAVGVADTIHIVAEYHRRLALGAGREEALVESLSHLLVPCLMTSATTVIGLLSLLASDLGPIREFAIFSSVGVASAFLLSITLAPALLSLTKSPGAAYMDRMGKGLAMRSLQRLGTPTRRTSFLTIIVTLVLIAGSALLVPGIGVGSNMIRFFKTDSRVRVDADAIDQALGGTFALQVLISTPAQGLKDPDTLNRIDALQVALMRHQGVSRVTSIVDNLKELGRALHGEDFAYHKVPASRETVAQYFLLLEGEKEFKKLVQGDYSVGRLTVRFKQAGLPGQWYERVQSINEEIARAFDAPIKVESTGIVRLTAQLDHYFVHSLIKSFLLAFCVISLVMFFMLRSVKLAILAMIPNLVPIFIGMGFMSLVGISLNPGTLMIASIAIGLVVDDTVHLLYRFKASAGADEPREAISTAVAEAGNPVLCSSLVLSAGFLVMAFAQNVASIHFALVVTVVIIVAVLADLVLLPAVLLLTSRQSEPR